MENNQALTMYPLFFDPIYKKAEMKKIDGKDCICYQEDFWGTKVEEDGSVTFTMEAPKAETVEVSGFGGTLGTEKIALEKQAKSLAVGTVEDIVAFPHPYGCSQMGGDQENTRKALADLIHHPNAGGVLVLGLG